MSTAYWLYAGAVASAASVLVQMAGAGLEKLLRTYKPATWPLRLVKFVAFFVFVFYAIVRTPALDQRLPPFAFLIGWLVIFGPATHLASRRHDATKDSVGPTPSDSAKVD